MHAADFVGAVEIGERARHAQYAMIAAGGEPKIYKRLRTGVIIVPIPNYQVIYRDLTNC